MKKRVNLKGNTLVYEIQDINKPVCLCLHGMNMSMEMFKLKPLYTLLKDYSLVLVDICGYGDSKLDPSTFTMDIHNELLKQLMIQENISTCCLCGYCLGGILGLDFTIKNPDKIHTLILIETMIYLPKWLWLCTLPGYSFFYSHFQKQHQLLKLLEIFPMFYHISHPERIRISNYSWNRKVNTFYLRLMHQYQKINHIKRCEPLHLPIHIIYSPASFSTVKKTAKELSIYSFVTLYTCHTPGHFLFLDPSLENISFLSKELPYDLYIFN